MAQGDISTKQIGDGELPNKYWVSVSNDYQYFDEEDGTLNSASERDRFKVVVKTIGVYDTYREARNVMDSIEVNFNSDIRSVFIEDRLSGEVAETVLIERIIPAHVEYDEEFNEDVRYTRKAMEEKGYKFK